MAKLAPLGGGQAAIDLGLGDQLKNETADQIAARRKKMLKMGQPGAQNSYGMDPGATMGMAAQVLGLGASR